MTHHHTADPYGPTPCTPPPAAVPCRGAYVVLLFSRMAEPYQTLYTTCSPTHGLYTHGPVQSSSLLYTQRERLLMFNWPEVVLFVHM